eukprot:scaffold647908_cov46-Prasinocladus_malaysianus.AAC.1
MPHAVQMVWRVQPVLSRADTRRIIGYKRVIEAIAKEEADLKNVLEFKVVFVIREESIAFHQPASIPFSIAIVTAHPCRAKLWDLLHSPVPPEGLFDVNEAVDVDLQTKVIDVDRDVIRLHPSRKLELQYDLVVQLWWVAKLDYSQ